MTRRAGEPEPAQRSPIVVGGCHRSGTSLVRRILDAHPNIHCGPELTFFRDFHGDFASDPLRHLRFSTTARSVADADAALRILGRAFIDLHEHAAAEVGKPRWADKSPDNAIHLDDWGVLLGDGWPYVHVIRNPLDTLASVDEARFPLTIPPDLEGRIDFYNRYTGAGLDFARAHPERSYIVSYERLVADPEAETARLMAALGEQSTPAQLAFNDASHQSGLEDPKVAATTTVHSEGVGRWRGTFSPAEVATIVRRTAAVWRPVAEALGVDPQPMG